MAESAARGGEHLGAMSAAAAGRASAAEAAAIACRRPRARGSCATSSRRRSGVRSSSRMTVAAPARAIHSALVVWWSALACGYGMRTAGSPYWASSKTEPPERATARSAAASAWPNGVT